MPAIPALTGAAMRGLRGRLTGLVVAALLATMPLLPASAQNGAQALQPPPDASAPAAAAGALTDAKIPAMDSPVVDTTGTLDANARAQLDAQARALQQRKGAQLQILMVASTQPEDIDSYAVRAFEQFKLGRKGISDGVLLVVAKDDRRVRIEVGYGLEGAITDAQAGRIIQEYITPKFRTGDYAGGLSEASAMLTQLIDGEPLPPPLADQSGGDAPDEDNWMLAVFIGLFGAGFLRGLLGRLPGLARGLISGVLVAGVAWLLSLAWWAIGLAGLIGLLFGMFGGGGGQFVGGGGWGGYSGGGWGGGGGGGGGGWSGGGGSSGGGGASGSW